MSVPHNTGQTGPIQPETPQSLETEESGTGFDVDDLLSDAKFPQDTAIELQNAYDTLQQRYAQQVLLIQEASGALHVAETQASQRQQELLNLQKDHEADIQLAVGQVVFELKEQLTAAKHSLHVKEREHKQMVHKLQDQVCALKLSLASQATLPSVRTTQKEADLWDEVFNYLLGTVNIKRSAAIYDTQDQPFSFRKHVQFGDRSQVPDLKQDADSDVQQNLSQANP